MSNFWVNIVDNGILRSHIQANEEVTKNLQQTKAILYGDGGDYSCSVDATARLTLG